MSVVRNPVPGTVERWFLVLNFGLCGLPALSPVLVPHSFLQYRPQRGVLWMSYATSGTDA
eukprot:1856946-Rhodomonas_salina.5